MLKPSHSLLLPVACSLFPLRVALYEMEKPDFKNLEVYRLAERLASQLPRPQGDGAWNSQVPTKN